MLSTYEDLDMSESAYSHHKNQLVFDRNSLIISYTFLFLSGLVFPSFVHTFTILTSICLEYMSARTNVTSAQHRPSDFGPFPQHRPMQWIRPTSTQKDSDFDTSYVLLLNCYRFHSKFEVCGLLISHNNLRLINVIRRQPTATSRWMKDSEFRNTNSDNYLFYWCCHCRRCRCAFIDWLRNNAMIIVWPIQERLKVTGLIPAST
jgi:hypothetical protein